MGPKRVEMALIWMTAAGSGISGEISRVRDPDDWIYARTSRGWGVMC